MVMRERGPILFVDDESMVRSAFARGARAFGFDVDVCSDFESARGHLAERDYAVVATDYFMPDVNGLDLIERCRELQPNATFVLVSGECDLDLALRAINDFGVFQVVAKPWNTQELSVVLGRAIALYKERSAGARMQEELVAVQRRQKEREQRFEEAVRHTERAIADTLLGALALRGHESRAHCRRVAAYASRIAEEMGLRGHLVQSIEEGALLHDIGMIGIADAILLKPRGLTDSERD